MRPGLARGRVPGHVPPSLAAWQSARGPGAFAGTTPALMETGKQLPPGAPSAWLPGSREPRPRRLSA